MKKLFIQFKTHIDNKPLTCQFGRWMKIKFIIRKMLKYIICQLALPACQMVDVLSVFDLIKYQLGLGGCDGCSKIINLRYHEIETYQHNQNFVVRGIDFTSDNRYLITVTPEMSVDIIPNVRDLGNFKINLFIF